MPLVCWEILMEAVVHYLEVCLECGHICLDLVSVLLVNRDALDELRDLAHVRFLHADAGHFLCTQPYS